MPIADPSLQPHLIPERRPPNIIDIDALETDNIVFVGSARPSQRRRVAEDGSAVPVTSEVINITDSEDDNEIQFIGHNPARPPPSMIRARRHRIFSPPPPPQIGGIPPVPPIPERFLPLPSRLTPGLVIPDEVPLPWEVDLRPPRPAEHPQPAAAPPSRHIPSMGFGGALLAGMRQFIGPRHQAQRPERHNGWGVSGSFIVRWDPFDFAGEEGEGAELLDGLDFLAEDNALGAGGVRQRLERAFKQRDHGSKAEPDYKPEYTHPDPPLPGFTHDFSLSPSSPSSVASEDGATTSRIASGSGTQLCDAILVCASCQDPLIVGASDIGENRAKRKLWGLRCGHLLDGKCVEKLMQPAPPTPEMTGSSGKRKAIDPELYSPSLSRDPGPSTSSMRSRLRPRRGMAGQHTSVSHAASASTSSGHLTAAPQNHRSNRKGKGKMKAPAVEAEHEWNCPVGGCGRVHLSLLMDGRWTTDEKRGAIAMFV